MYVLGLHELTGNLIQMEKYPNEFCESRGNEQRRRSNLPRSTEENVRQCFVHVHRNQKIRQFLATLPARCVRSRTISNGIELSTRQTNVNHNQGKGV